MKKIKYAARLSNLERSAIRKLFDNAPSDSINFGLGEIQFPTPEILSDRAIKIIKNNSIGYTPNAGLPELQSSICKNYKIELDNNVCVTAGAEEAIFATLFSYIEPGDEVLISNPTYLAYKTIIKMLDGIPVEFELDPDNEFALGENDFLKKISPKTKILLLSNPSNPTGKIFSADEIDLIVRVCQKNNILLVVDEIYRELYIENKIDSLINNYENTLIISGLSKSHCMSGWRIGWAVANDPELIRPIIVSHQYICTCAPYVSQKIAVVALSDEGMAAAQSEIRAKLIDNRNFLLTEFINNFPQYRILNSNSFPYLFFRIDNDDIQFVNKMINEGLILMPGSIFGSNGKNWIRLNYAVDKNKLAKGINILKYNDI